MASYKNQLTKKEEKRKNLRHYKNKPLLAAKKLFIFSENLVIQASFSFGFMQSSRFVFE